MYLRLKVGPRKGEVIEMKFADARMLLADGRAELAYPGDAAVVAAASPAPPVPTSPGAQRKPAQASPELKKKKGK